MVSKNPAGQLRLARLADRILDQVATAAELVADTFDRAVEVTLSAERGPLAG
jgi:hypothetical protein